MKKLGLILLLACAQTATADTPAFLDGKVLDTVCKPMKAFEKCPTCECEPITQSNPTEQWTLDATDIPTATLVRVHGKVGERKVEAIHVVLGHEKALYLGGRAIDVSTEKGFQASYKIIGSQRHYEMCPGACGHDTVGAVHLFEVEEYLNEPTEADNGMRHESKTRSLVSCYMYDDKEPVECFKTTLGFEQRPFHPARKRQKRFVGWQRTWGFGGSTGMLFKVGKLKGKGARAAKKEGVGQAPKVSPFRELGKRPDTVKITEKGQGTRVL